MTTHTTELKRLVVTFFHAEIVQARIDEDCRDVFAWATKHSLKAKYSLPTLEEMNNNIRIIRLFFMRPGNVWHLALRRMKKAVMSIVCHFRRMTLHRRIFIRRELAQWHALEKIKNNQLCAITDERAANDRKWKRRPKPPTQEEMIDRLRYNVPDNTKRAILDDYYNELNLVCYKNPSKSNAFRLTLCLQGETWERVQAYETIMSGAQMMLPLDEISSRRISIAQQSKNIHNPHWYEKWKDVRGGEPSPSPNSSKIPIPILGYPRVEAGHKENMSQRMVLSDLQTYLRVGPPSTSPVPPTEEKRQSIVVVIQPDTTRLPKIPHFRGERTMRLISDMHISHCPRQPSVAAPINVRKHKKKRHAEQVRLPLLPNCAQGLVPNRVWMSMDMQVYGSNRVLK